MSIQKISQTSITTRILKNKTVLNTLEKISEHGTSFSAGASLLLSLSVRPLAIHSTPDVEKENKQYAISNSIGSGLMKFAMVEAVALPIENAVKKIDQNPEKFLKKLPTNTNSKSYKLMTQIIKLGAGFITAVPKSVLTVALIPVIMDKIFKIKKPTHQPQQEKPTPQSLQTKQVPFGGISDKLAKEIGKILDKEGFQKFATKHQNNDKDIAKHMTAATDILLTTTSAVQTSRSKNIKENRKKALIYNNVISTAITLTFGYIIDRIAKNKTGKFIEKFKQINAGNPKVHKYIEGINILRPALIFAAIYYGLLPMVSTYMAEKIDKFIVRHNAPTNE